MPIGKLLITPDPDQSPPRVESLIDALAQLQLIKSGSESPDSEIYFAGERFLKLITFLGCSPHVRLEPESDDDQLFTHLRISGPHGHSQFRWGTNTVAPRCPACKSKLPLWRDQIPRWQQQRFNPLACSDCSTTRPLASLDWRGHAGSGVLFIEVWGIFPGEAVPSDELMSALSQLDASWRYFYVQE